MAYEYTNLSFQGESALLATVNTWRAFLGFDQKSAGFGLGKPEVNIMINPMLRMEMTVKNYADCLKKYK